MSLALVHSAPFPTPAGRSIHEALTSVLAGIAPVSKIEVVSARDAIGRILALDVHAPVALPRFSSSAMDGYGLHGDDRAGSSERILPVSLLIYAGPADHATSLEPGKVVRLTTGAAVPDGVAAVVPDEDVDLGEGSIRVLEVPEGGANIRWRGEDVKAGSIVARAGARLTAPLLILLAATGIDMVRVRRRPRVGLLSSGNELVEPGMPPAPGQIVDTNRMMLRHLLAEADAEVIDFGIVPDRLTELGQAMSGAGGVDLLITSGGAANSEADLIAKAVSNAGGSMEMLVLDLKPGRRVAHGAIGHSRVLSLPGNPAAALVTGILFALPIVHQLAGKTWRPAWQTMPLLVPLKKRSGRAEFIMARTVRNGLGQIEGVVPVGPNDSHRLLPLSQADGMLCVPADQAAVDAGDTVPFLPMVSIFGSGVGSPN